MLVGIIHNPKDGKRMDQLMGQLQEQRIRNYTLFPAIIDRRSTKRGINLAHKSIVETARDLRMDRVAILEDDVLFTHPQSWAKFLADMPKSFDIYLGGCYIPEFSGESLISWCGMHCYIIHSRFYNEFLSLPEDEHIDRALAGKGEFHLSKPMIAIQSNGYSSNTKKEEDYSPLLVGAELFRGY